jgi:release factor glutamine methyltransferase
LSEVDWTIRRMLEWMTRDFTERGIDSPRLDAELLVSHALDLARVALYMDLDRPLAPSELDAIRALVKRRRGREPIAYIVGVREFWKRDFAVSPAVLVPRPDTEILVSEALARLPIEQEARVLDLCTGSGILAITLAAERPLVRAIGTDLSPEALTIATQNAARHGVADRVDLRLGDLAMPVRDEAPFDVIVSNPPYIPTREVDALMPEVSRHEPRMALDGGEDGFAFHRRLVSEAAPRLVPGGSLLVEVGQGQAEALVGAFAADGRYEPAGVAVDYGGVARVEVARIPGRAP